MFFIPALITRDVTTALPYLTVAAFGLAAQNPPITGYQVPLREMAVRAVDLLVERMGSGDDADVPPVLLRFPGRIVVRGSTARPAGST